jgi:ABC-2 type transport system permease protein
MSTQSSNASAKRSSKPFWELVKIQGKLALREPYGVIFGVALPVFLLVIFSFIPAFRDPLPGTSLTVFEIYLPILMITILIMIGLIGLPVSLVRDREIGWLRRISTTPVLPSKLLAAQVTINTILAVVGFVILWIGSVFIFGLRAQVDIIGFVLSLVLATVAMFSLGLVVAALAPSQGAATGITMGLLYPLLFFAGVYVPMQMLPEIFQTISGFTPVGAAVVALGDAMQGSFPSIVSLAVMAFYAVLLGYVAIRYFKWE